MGTNYYWIDGNVPLPEGLTEVDLHAFTTFIEVSDPTADGRTILDDFLRLRHAPSDDAAAYAFYTRWYVIRQQAPTRWHDPRRWHDPYLVVTRHIGKSSGGWCFSLRVYPEDNIHDLVDWHELWTRPLTMIEDEYGRRVSADEMLKVVTDRRWGGSEALRGSDFMYTNHAVDGPNGLLRHSIDDRCIGHGAGTWDLIVGDFS